MANLEELTAKKTKLKELQTACTTIQSKLTKYSTALNTCKNKITTSSADTFSAYTFEVDLADNNFLEGIQHFVDSEGLFRLAYTSGEYIYNFFRDIETSSTELMSSIAACREEFVRLKEVIEGYETTVSTMSGNVSTVKAKIETEIESVERAIAALEE